MCGIAFACVTHSCDPAASGNGHANDNANLEMASKEWLAALRSRGPDFLGSQSVEARDIACRLHFIASLLQLRGIKPGRSPGVSAHGHILCFNGEVFGGLDVPPGENDGARLLASLAESDPRSVPELVSRLRGPWALLFWDPIRQLLWFGRDLLGRRSLLVHFPSAADPRLLLSSVSELPRDPSFPAAGCGPAASAVSSVTGMVASENPNNVGVTAPLQYSAADGGDSGDCARADDADAEPSGSDGYWTELPPGLYSISLASPPKLQKDDLDAPSRSLLNPRKGISAGATAAPVYPAAQLLTHEVRGQSAVVRQLAVGACELVLERHPWRDPLLLELEAYVRVESGFRRRMPTADATPQAVPDAVLAAPVGDAEGVGKEGIDLAEKQERQAPSAATADGGGAPEGLEANADACPQCLIPEPLLAGLVSPPRAQPGCWSHLPRTSGEPYEELVHGLLSALLTAMRVRCARIETRSPHPSAAYAAALTALSGAVASSTASPPQPSWRRDNPLDFSLVPTEEPPAQRDAVASVCGGNGGSDSGPWLTGHGKGACAADLDSSPGEASGPIDQRLGGMTSRDAPIMILFSGGVDSVLLAALAHRVLPLDVPIDLCNVCFGGGGGPSPDREAARDALEELAVGCSGRCWRLVEVDASLDDVDRHRSRLLALLRPAHTVMDFNIGAALWLATSGQGTLRLPSSTTSARPRCHHPASTSFPSPSAPSASIPPPPSLPSAPSGYTPASSILSPSPSPSPAVGDFYGSAARVVLLGHGADEQCGGYGRHRTRFRSGGWASLAEELEVDVRRLWLRNLGRDDRLVADWGREARHPFLDEEVMQVLLRARLDSIVDLRLPAGQGDKHVLRSALALLGLPRAAARVKRAIQFGSRIGKASNTRDFGSNRQANLRNAGCVALQDVKKMAATVAIAAAAPGGPGKPAIKKEK
ncbi:hypothetical protein VaNZ11_008836 [Volvox africanus]|uniref:Asparagine synthetase domain-containing protein n=1 Tax=Volvox africanus TaxID=51714 RepID=A0ABQ5S6F5_9CHLO|nr:hypothetical protein VaNZ11_008836 [Volvox africanus]